MQDSARMRYLVCGHDHASVPHYLSDTLAVIKRMTLEDESDTHLALGKGVRGEEAAAECSDSCGARAHALTDWRLKPAP